MCLKHGLLQPSPVKQELIYGTVIDKKTRTKKVGAKESLSLPGILSFCR
jgi:hypothetical protein